MAYLVDANILARSVEVKNPKSQAARDAVALLLGDGEQLFTITQVMSEFWNVCTRPAKDNGLGMSVTQTEAEIVSLESFIPVLPDLQLIYPEWRRIVLQHAVKGKRSMMLGSLPR